MEVCYVVTFKPQEVRAYAAELIVVTEREKFIVPVGALGHRAVLDFPDHVSKNEHAWGNATVSCLAVKVSGRAAKLSSCKRGRSFRQIQRGDAIHLARRHSREYLAVTVVV